MTPASGRSVPPPSLARRLEAIAPLADRLRRRLFLVVAESPDPVTRDEAAMALGISRSLAAFHLDRLHRAGLLAVGTRRRITADGAAGRGRPAKAYRIPDHDLELSIPPRRYAFAAELFADALASIDRPAGLDRAAAERGRRLGESVRERAGRRSGRARRMAELQVVLDEFGYAPRTSADGAGLCLDNCPFESLAVRQRGLTCPTNRALLEGVLDGAGIDGLESRLEPEPGRCCVVLRPPPGGPPRDRRPSVATPPDPAPADLPAG